jgi:hypothetical protein
MKMKIKEIIKKIHDWVVEEDHHEWTEEQIDLISTDKFILSM